MDRLSLVSFLATKATFPTPCHFNKRVVGAFHLQDASNSSNALCVSPRYAVGDSERSPDLARALPPFLRELPADLHPACLLQGWGSALRGHTTMSPAPAKLSCPLRGQFNSFLTTGGEGALKMAPGLPGALAVIFLQMVVSRGGGKSVPAGLLDS